VKLGYREEYLLRISEAIVEKKFSLDELKKMSYEEAMKNLQSLHGIGEKVANCVALFGLYNIEAFPVDVWIKKIIQCRYNGYFSLEKLGLKDIGGLVQQYMYFYERNL
jgi:N-glycosylase/DNA lyase